MSQAYIHKALRERVAAQAGNRCGYCRTSSSLVGTSFEVDHIIPESLGGRTEEENLWLACSACNDHKSNRIAAADPTTGEIVRLFDPRRQSWSEHFAWNEVGDEIIGLTPTGRGYSGGAPSEPACARLCPLVLGEVGLPPTVGLRASAPNRQS